MMSHEKESFLYKPSNPKIPGVSLILTLFRPNFDLDSQKKRGDVVVSPFPLFFHAFHKNAADSLIPLPCRPRFRPLSQQRRIVFTRGRCNGFRRIRVLALFLIVDGKRTIIVTKVILMRF